MAGDFHVHVGSNAEDCEVQHGGYGYGIRNKEAKEKRFASSMQL